MPPNPSWIDRDALAELVSDTAWTKPVTEAPNATTAATSPGAPPPHERADELRVGEPEASDLPRADESPLAEPETSALPPRANEAALAEPETRAPPPPHERGSHSLAGELAPPPRARHRDPTSESGGPRRERRGNNLTRVHRPRRNGRELSSARLRRLEDMLEWALRAGGLQRGAVVDRHGHPALKRGEALDEQTLEHVGALARFADTLPRDALGHVYINRGDEHLVMSWYDDPPRRWIVVLLGDKPPTADALGELAVALQDAFE